MASKAAIVNYGKEYEIHVSASYVTDGGTKEHNSFKVYVVGKTAVEVKKALRRELKAEGYKGIEMNAIATGK